MFLPSRRVSTSSSSRSTASCCDSVGCTTPTASCSSPTFFSPSASSQSSSMRSGLARTRISAQASCAAAQRIVEFARGQRLEVAWILETHAHADHLSAASWLRRELGGRIAVGRRITEVQGVFKRLFHLEPEFAPDGHQFDHLFADGETFAIGALQARVIAMPGHTPACVAYQVADAVFVGDTLFMPDVGTARCDFPGGSAAQLYRSIRKILSLPPSTRLF